MFNNEGYAKVPYLFISYANGTDKYNLPESFNFVLLLLVWSDVVFRVSLLVPFPAAFRTMGGCLLLLFCFSRTDAQAIIRQVRPDDSLVTVDKILILGNRVTKERIILRELSLQGDTTLSVSDLRMAIERDQKKLINTRLFLTATIDILPVQAQYVDLVVRVSERWYTVPAPFFRLADRNFNVWFTNQNRDWSRVIYGIRFIQYNFRGLNQRLYLLAQFGFSQQFAARYLIPYVDRAQKNGLEFAVSYFNTPNVNYITRDHRLLFTQGLDVGKRSVAGLVGWRHRPSFYNTHFVELEYTHRHVADTIAQLNPNYFLHNSSRQRYFSLVYRFVSDYRDYLGFPLKGHYWEAEAEKLGVGLRNEVNLLRLSAVYSHYFELGNGFYVASSMRGYLSTPRRQPYANFIGLGYNTIWLRGYELDAIEGQSYLIHQNTLRKRIFSRQFDISQLMPLPQFRMVPLHIYLNTYFDHGYLSNTVSYEQSNRLSNRYLMGYGVGLDIVTFYDFVFRAEHTWRIDGNRGFYFHIRSAF